MAREFDSPDFGDGRLVRLPSRRAMAILLRVAVAAAGVWLVGPIVVHVALVLLPFIMVMIVLFLGAALMGPYGWVHHRMLAAPYDAYASARRSRHERFWE
jgi:hypothetical protein